MADSVKAHRLNSHTPVTQEEELHKSWWQSTKYITKHEIAAQKLTKVKSAGVRESRW